MKDAGNIFLVGMMGAGKTTVARLLAGRLNRAFIDADLELERRCGVKVPVIFEIEGEAGFRTREAISSMSSRRAQVLSSRPAGAPCCARKIGSGSPPGVW